MKQDPVRVIIDIPAALHGRLEEEAARRGCSTRELIVGYLERLAAERPRRVALPLVRTAGRGTIAGVTNDEALFG